MTHPRDDSDPAATLARHRERATPTDTSDLVDVATMLGFCNVAVGAVTPRMPLECRQR
jgi:hypothetical protein